MPWQNLDEMETMCDVRAAFVQRCALEGFVKKLLKQWKLVQVCAKVQALKAKHGNNQR